MKSCVPGLGGDGHGGGGEVLHLFELEVEVFGQCSEFCHVFSCTAWVRTDEVGDDLLTQVLTTVEFIKDALKVVEEFERGFAHEVEHTVGGVFWRHFQTATDVFGDEFLCVLTIDAIDAFIACVVKQEVITDA